VRHIEKHWNPARHHSKFCAVSPTDPDPRWPDGSVAVLREAGAQELDYAKFRGIALEP